MPTLMDEDDPRAANLEMRTALEATLQVLHDGTHPGELAKRAPLPGRRHAARTAAVRAPDGAAAVLTGADQRLDPASPHVEITYPGAVIRAVRRAGSHGPIGGGVHGGGSC